MSYIGTEPKDIRSFGRTQFDYTATQGQTAFTGADDDGKVLAFTTGQINVYVNGILMDDSDFTTTGTGTVTLASAANLNDIISIVSFESNIPDNDYVPASGGTFTGNVTNSGTVTNSGNVTVGGTLGVTGATTMTGTLVAGTRLQVGDSSITQQYPALGYVADFQASSGSQTFISIAEPSASSLGNNGVIIGEDASDTYITQRGNKNIKLATQDLNRLIVDGSGRVTMPYQPSFSAYRDAGHVTAGNVYIFDHTNYNIGGMYNTSNGRATVPVDGRYLLSVWLMTQNDATYNNDYFRIRINSASPAYKNIYSSNGGAVHHQWSWAGVINLTANDYVDIYIDGFTAYGTNGLYSNFSMHLLS